MMNVYIKVKDWILSLFKKKNNVIKLRKKSRNMKAVRQEMAMDGQFNNIKDMGESVDRVYKSLIKSKKIPLVNQLKKLGVYVIEGGTNLSKELDSFSVMKCPSIMMCAHTFKDGVSINIATKVKSYNVQPFDGVVYNVHMIKNDEFGFMQCEIFIGVGDNGEITPLRQKKEEYTQITRNIGYHCNRWGYQPITNEDDDSMFNTYKYIFAGLYNSSVRRECGTQVNFTKRGLKIVASVPENTWGHFFKDRVSVTGVDGKKSKIWHCVMAHKRVNGQNVRTHFRGSRNFMWDGYEVKIIMPGFHADSMASFDLTSYDDSSVSELGGEYTEDIGKLGDYLADDKASKKHAIYAH